MSTPNEEWELPPPIVAHVLTYLGKEPATRCGASTSLPALEPARVVVPDRARRYAATFGHTICDRCLPLFVGYVPGSGDPP